MTREVLPALRKDGAYVVGEEKVRSAEMTEDELILKAFTCIKAKAERLAGEVKQLTVEKAQIGSRLSLRRPPVPPSLT